MTPSVNASLVGSVLGDRYELVRHIARGGMSDVYEGIDQLLQRPVAVKLYRSSAPTDRKRFDAEVTTLAALNHPGLVQVYDAGEWGDDGYVVLELVDGPTLRSILATRGPLSPGAVGSLGAAMATALAYVHAAGVVHRDVTPSNVLCGSDGRPRLADFGIARLLDTTRVTVTATAIGTAAYMAPEQVEGRDVTPAADVYALGLVLLEALTGNQAFTGASHEVAVARLARDPEIGPAVPASWAPLFRHMTARAPGDRPTAEVVADRLRDLESTAPRATAVIGSHRLVDAEAQTEAVVISGGTTVMPAVLLPEAPSHGEPADSSGRVAAVAGTSRALWAVVAAIALIAVLVFSQAGDGIDVPTPTTSDPVSVTSQPPPTTSPPTTAEPAAEGPGKGKGRDKGDD